MADDREWRSEAERRRGQVVSPSVRPSVADHSLSLIRRMKVTAMPDAPQQLIQLSVVRAQQRVESSGVESDGVGWQSDRGPVSDVWVEWRQSLTRDQPAGLAHCQQPARGRTSNALRVEYSSHECRHTRDGRRVASEKKSNRKRRRKSKRFPTKE